MNNEKELTHIDLFSGIGGFTLAGEWAGFRTTVFCEKEPFCQKILQKHWPKIPIVPEIRDFDGTEWKGATLLTGGFPCQPFSDAGERRGKEDDRYLWPEMLRVILEGRPRWMLAENVSGIVKMALDTVLSDLENEGYAAEVFTIPACAVDAPHRRNRVWIVAHCTEKSRRTKQKSQQPTRHTSRKTIRNINSDTSNPDEKRLERQVCQKQPRNNRRFTTQNRGQPESWNKDWYEIVARFCRVDDGVPDRVHRLKALGNAIVPQVAYEIMKNIVQIEKGSYV